MLEHAFGPTSLGILLVKDLPPSFSGLRQQLLSFSSYLANLPTTELGRQWRTRSLLFLSVLTYLSDKLENPKAKYLIGWSLGKETLASGRFDNLKGSFYANCSFYNPPSPADTQSTVKQFPNFPEYTAPNVWPPLELLPGFKEVFQLLCTVIIDTATLVAAACDQYAEAKIEGYEKGYLARVVKTSSTTKARLLHYFPPPKANSSDLKGANGNEDDWCATHVDHGCLTGLTSAMFVDETVNSPRGSFCSTSSVKPLPELASSPDPDAGLYIRSRTGETIKVTIPKDCLAFQTGETLELITKGRFKAVPHFVRGAQGTPEVGKIARNTIAVFTRKLSCLDLHQMLT